MSVRLLAESLIVSRDLRSVLIVGVVVVVVVEESIRELLLEFTVKFLQFYPPVLPLLEKSLDSYFSLPLSFEHSNFRDSKNILTDQ